MRVLIVSPVFPPYRGGIGVAAEQEARLLRAQGFAVRALTPRYASQDTLVDSDEVVRVRPWFMWGNGAILPFFALWRALRAADVIHLHYPFFGSAFVVALFVRMLHKRLVVTWHMRARVGKKAWMRNALFFFHRIFEEPVVLRLAHAVCVSSDDYAQMFAKYAHKMHVVPFGVDTKRFFPGTSDAFRVAHGALPSTCVYLFVGGLDTAHAFKGVLPLLSAFGQLSLAHDWRLWLVGSGDLQKEYEAHARTLPGADRITFLGSVPFADLPSVYRAADVHVLPSVSTAETYGIVTCEAGASGLPSIVTDLPGVRGRVREGKTGFVVPPNDISALVQACTYFLEHPEQRRVMGDSAVQCMQVSASEDAELRGLLRAYGVSASVGL